MLTSCYMKSSVGHFHPLSIVFICTLYLVTIGCKSEDTNDRNRSIELLNDNWRFYKYDNGESDSLIYDVRPAVDKFRDNKAADEEPTVPVDVSGSGFTLKQWILPTANKFIKNPENQHLRPDGHPGSDFPFVRNDFDDSSWREVSLPHDWGVEEPFQKGWDSQVGGGMGRLPAHGVAWYRKKIGFSEDDIGKSVFLDIDGAMSYAIVWFNGHLVGGWPYGYNSWRVELTDYVIPGEENQLAIRIDNPPKSARWYPGGGLYRNVWLVKTHKVHVAQWGTFVTIGEVSESGAEVQLEVTVMNSDDSDAKIDLVTEIYHYESPGSEKPVESFPIRQVIIKKSNSKKVKSSVNLPNPRLWGPPPTQKPNLYLAVTKVLIAGKVIDEYQTRFGIRSLELDPERGVLVNGEHIYLKGVNLHHDLGALGAAFNTRAAERQLEILKKMGCNAIRLAHNPSAPEFLELTDRMGFLVVNEIFDVWERKKTPLDFHLIFPDWHEPDIRAFVRRDRNAPSVIMWSFGNEVGEQYTNEEGAAIGKKLSEIVKEEDPGRPTTASMNYAKPHMPFPEIMDAISLNYQGEGIRDAPAYSHLKGIKTPPLYGEFKEKFPDKVIFSSETASALSTRGTYLFPVFEGESAPVEDGSGGDPDNLQVSSYELYTSQFGASADKVFASLDKHPYVAGEFVWSGFDYLGEPTPYYLARSSYSGIVDLAGFEKDRFFLYQSRWRPDHPMVHILPHWNWPDRENKKSPVHVITSGDEVELFLNGISMGRKEKREFEYRLRWDDIIYQAGTLKAVAYKNGKVWAEKEIVTTGKPAKLVASADRSIIDGDGKDLCFVSVEVQDANGFMVPEADALISFSIEGPAEIIATDNGNPADFRMFNSKERNAFSGRVLAIIRSRKDESGKVIIRIASEGLKGTEAEISLR